MNLEQIEQALNEWAEQVGAVEKAIAGFVEHTGADHDSRLLKPINNLLVEYTDAVSKLVGDEESWLQYYWMDCDMGKKPLKVNGTPLKTIRQLAALIHNRE